MVSLPLLRWRRRQKSLCCQPGLGRVLVHQWTKSKVQLGSCGGVNLFVKSSHFRMVAFSFLSFYLLCRRHSLSSFFNVLCIQLGRAQTDGISIGFVFGTWARFLQWTVYLPRFIFWCFPLHFMQSDCTCPAWAQAWNLLPNVSQVT